MGKKIKHDIDVLEDRQRHEYLTST